MTLLDRFYGRMRKTPVDFVGNIHGRWKAELMPVILIGEPYMTNFDQTPQASRCKTHVPVEPEHPLVLTPSKCLETMLDEPC